MRLLIWGLEFWPPRTAQHPALTALLATDKYIEEARTPSWHNNERQVGVNRPTAMYHVNLGVAAFTSRLLIPWWTAKHPVMTANFD
ncbi:hypothetical protein THAOC_11711 [Thalassiosira oceanica]|uniref:Uncharacterized protein n=1 Tax=Thalassiosira oceanica TaxID=159749 RepID=K0SLW5_THAOC|nr:hypothetical protein THAOC_11711 [Thalassiosira oceanica]|eukprot:EJK67278.1 hypothetical protein THAOC_11711 [Thalassiosira oceanica]